LTTADLVVVELVVLEAAGLVVLIRSISALSFTVTEFSLEDAITVGTSPFGLWVAAASLVVVEGVVLEAASGLTLIRFISALGFAVTHLLGVDAVSIGTLPLALLAAALGTIIEWEVLEAAHIVTLIRSIRALSFTVTVLVVADALTVLAGELRGWVAATSLLVVEWEVLEAA